MPQVTLYRALLRCYPAAFRDEYGEQMLLAFTDQLNDAPGSTARAAIWTGAACDVLAVALLDRRNLRLLHLGADSAPAVAQ